MGPQKRGQKWGSEGVDLGSFLTSNVGKCSKCSMRQEFFQKVVFMMHFSTKWVPCYFPRCFSKVPKPSF